MASVPWGINHTCHSPELTIMPALQQILEQLAQQAHDHAMKIVSAGVLMALGWFFGRRGRGRSGGIGSFTTSSISR